MNSNEVSSVASLKNPDHFSEVKTQSIKMHAIFQQIEEIAQSSLPVLITGESGTGKGLIASAIHKASGRKGSFIEEKVGNFSDIQISKILFGSVDDSSNTKKIKGLVEKAQDGTLFLDEISHIPVQTQVSLIKLIQEMEDNLKDRKLQTSYNVRIILATSKILEAIIRIDLFPKDIYNRLKKREINLPPLRERKEDIPLLLDSFLKQSAKKLKKEVPDYTEELLHLLSEYNYPGNVRELAEMVYAAMGKHKEGPLSLDTFRKEISKQNKKAENKIFFGSFFPNFEEMKEIYFKEAMKQSNGNQTRAAKLSGINKETLSNFLNEINYKPKKDKK